MALSESNIFPEQSLQPIVSCISLDQADDMRSGETSNPENSLSSVSRLGRFLLGTSTKEGNSFDFMVEPIWVCVKMMYPCVSQNSDDKSIIFPIQVAIK